jgi:hypothetical protein
MAWSLGECYEARLDPFQWVTVLEDYLYPFEALWQVEQFTDAEIEIRCDRNPVAQRIVEFFSACQGDGFRLRIWCRDQLWFDSQERDQPENYDL